MLFFEAGTIVEPHIIGYDEEWTMTRDFNLNNLLNGLPNSLSPVIHLHILIENPITDGGLIA